MEPTQNKQERQYQTHGGSRGVLPSQHQRQQPNNGRSDKAYIDFYRQDSGCNPAGANNNPIMNQNMGSASTQREIYSDDNEGVPGTLEVDYKTQYILQDGDNPNQFYQHNSNSDYEESGSNTDMMGLGSRNIKGGDPRRQTIELESKKILDGFVEGTGVVIKQQQNKQYRDLDQKSITNNKNIGIGNKQSSSVTRGTNGGGLQRQNQQNNLEVVMGGNGDGQQNPYGLAQNEQVYYSQHQGSNNQNVNKQLAKSQSQNRLLFSSPDFQSKAYITAAAEGGQSRVAGGTGFGGNNNAQTSNNQQEKISFFKDQNNTATQNFQGQDLLYKQHLQYSTAGAIAKLGGAYQLKSNGNRFLSHNSTKECTYCNKTVGVSIGGGATVIPPCSAAICNDNQLGMMIQNDLSKKYSTNRDYYNVKIVNDLIYNENTHVVSIFKDYLILDDINEFLKRSYNQSEVKVRLPKLCSFYDKYSQVFPNFVVLPESKYMFKNIQRKQKLIDEQYQMQEEIAKKQHQSLLDEDKMFSSKFYNSVYVLNNDLSMSRQQYEDQAKQITIQAVQSGKYPAAGGRVGGRIDQMRIEELVDRFLMKDSESNIQLTTTMGVDFSQSIIMLPHHQNQGRPSDIQPHKQQQQISQQQQQQQKSKQNQVATASQKQQEQQVVQTKTNMQVTPATKTAFQFKEQQQNPSKTSKQNTAGLVSNNKATSGASGTGATKKTQQEAVMSTTSKKSSTGGALSSQLIAQSTQKRQKASFNTNTVGQRLTGNSLANTGGSNGGGGTGISRQQQDTSNRLAVASAYQGGNASNNINNNTGGGSNNTTPRLNKHHAVYNTTTTNQQQQQQEQQQPLFSQPQLSPDTKEAVANYLQLCQIELTQDQINNQLSSNNVQSIDSGNDKKNSGITTTTTGGGPKKSSNVYESPNMKSPQQMMKHTKKNTALISSGSQNAFHHNNMQSTLSLSNNRQIMRSQCQGVTTNNTATSQSTYQQQQQQQTLSQQQQQQQQIYNMKKTTSRLSGGAAALKQSSTAAKKQLAISPVPQNIYNTNQQYNNQAAASRNVLEQNSTQKSSKISAGGVVGAANTHAKYLSAGNDHYQRMLNTGNGNGTGVDGGTIQQIVGVNTIYTTNTHESVSTHPDHHSASKKFKLGNQQNKVVSAFQGQQHDGNIDDEQVNEIGGGGELLTGEDCCEGVADERLASPDVFSTGDDVGRKSLDNRSQNVGVSSGNGKSNILSGGGNTVMLTSVEGEKVLSQYTNYDQIKKHLEKYIQNNHQSSDALSTYKKFQEQSWDKQQQKMGAGSGSVVGGGIPSVGASLSNDTNNSRNGGGGGGGGATHKQFESLKQRIRGVFDSNTNSTDQHQQMVIQNSSINKTPIKGSTLSKKSQQEITQLNNNRMSIESRDMMIMQPPEQVSGLLSTTSAANNRLFPFTTQTSGMVNNYRSTTNLQHRKGSNHNFVNENSGEQQQLLQQQKRQSQKHPSFKGGVEVASSKDSKQVFKRCATGKTLSINEVHHTFSNGLQQQQSINNLSGTIGNNNNNITNSQTLVNPTFINSKMKQQQQQAANTVRVMTPSYSLASLSKVISPTQTTSPLTMTVTLAGSMQSRKQGATSQLGASKRTTTAGGNNLQGNQLNPLHSTGGGNSLLQNSQSQQTFLLSDKASKLISASKGNNHNNNTSSNSKAGGNNNSLSTNKLTQQKQGNSIVQTNNKYYNQQPVLQQSNSLSNLQIATPRGGQGIGNGIQQQDSFLRQPAGIGAYLYQQQQQQQQHQQQQHQEYSYQNMSCTAVSTENNSAVKTLESKHPKFMRTIEEYGVGGNTHQQSYNNILSVSGGGGIQKKTGGGGHGSGLSGSQSQSQFDLKQRQQKLTSLGSTAAIAAHQQAKKQLQASSSVSHFKTPSQQIQAKKSGSNKFQQF